MVEELKKNIKDERTYKVVRAVIFNPDCVKFGIIGMGLPPKYLYVQTFGE